jgi:hypothetical protein
MTANVRPSGDKASPLVAEHDLGQPDQAERVLLVERRPAAAVRMACADPAARP